MKPIRLATTKEIILPQHVESVQIVEGRPVRQYDSTLMYSYGLDSNGYNTLLHTPTAAVIRYISGHIEIHSGVDRDIIWAAFNEECGDRVSIPECQMQDEQEGPALVRGYDIVLEVTGNRPKPAMTEWSRGYPTFKVVSWLHKCADLPQKVFKVLQDNWYLDYSIKVKEEDQLVLDDHQGLWLMTPNPKGGVLADSTLLMAYTSYVEAL